MTMPHRIRGLASEPDPNEDVHPDVDRIKELEAAVDATYRVLRSAQTAYELAARDSNHDNLDDDPQVVATRELRDMAQRAAGAAADRLDEVLTFAPLVLTKDGCTPQSRRSATAWANSRGPGEALSGAMRQVLSALNYGRRVTITIE